MTFAFHISRTARERYGVERELFTLTGNAVLPDFSAGRRLAQRMNEDPARAGDPMKTVHAGQLNAMGLLDEILHAVVALYREEVNPGAMTAALAFASERVGRERLESALTAFATAFPTANAIESRQPPAGYLAGSTDGIPNREIALEELLMLWLGNANPAFAPFEELFDDAGLVASTPYPDVIAALTAHFATQPPFGPDGQTLVEMLRAPAVAVPDSIAGQLRFVRERWLSILGRFGDRLLTSLDVLAEEEQGLWRRFHPSPGGDAGDAARRASRAWLTESGWAGGGGDAEAERFSMDRDWMPRLVLIAKSSFVWLDQLSKRYGRSIARLDEIPDEELDQLARWGFSGLWLIGLWQRSRASQTIKQLRGNPEAVASAYSLDDYRIADDLGGEEAFERLKTRAWQRGLRIASDMVPNHMGVDSRWVVEHPDWFMSLPQPPYPAYSFNGPDLSQDGRVGIQIEDHYFDNSDAAVVFKRWDRASGETRFIYHGNDGTSMPWNDTAQLDYLKPEVREAVIQAILGVARRSPVIRFDAAMTLAKRHIERLWYPEPGHGGAIPSRAEHALPREAFERAMPVEFWREVVDRVAAEVPDTLLLAEAFWLMEGYFVRTLGMHRVYNSAFMNMLRDEQNSNYRSVIRNTIEFDPEVLKRYVNFMNNPDERTAVDQFGKGDKYFGIATLMATLPGLPMFGHGQVEGFTEKYGMEYRRAYWDEQPDPWLVERHEREIAPLLHRRRLFAEVDDFLLFDFVRDEGTVDEDVFAYANRGGGEASLIVYNNRYGSTSGRISESAPYSARVGEGRETRRRTIGEGLGLHADEGWYVALRDARSGLEFLHGSRDVRDQGLRLALDAYTCRVFLGIREVQDLAGRPWGRLAAELGGRGVPSLDDALRDLLLRPVQEPLRRLLEPARLHRVAMSSDGEDAALRDDVRALLGAARGLLGTWPTDDGSGAERVAAALMDGLRTLGDPAPTAERAAGAAAVSGPTDATVRATDARSAEASAPRPEEPVAAAWVLLHELPSAVGGGAVPSVDAVTPSGGGARGWIDEWRLAPPMAEAFREAGLPEADAWRTIEAVKALLTLPPWGLERPVGERVAAILRAWVADESAVRFLQVNVHRDVRWFNREAFEALARWAALVERLRSGEPRTPAEESELARTLGALVAAAADSGYRLDALPAATSGPAVERTTRSG